MRENICKLCIYKSVNAENTWRTQITNNKKNQFLKILYCELNIALFASLYVSILSAVVLGGE